MNTIACNTPMGLVPGLTHALQQPGAFLSMTSSGKQTPPPRPPISSPHSNSSSVVATSFASSSLQMKTSTTKKTTAITSSRPWLLYFIVITVCGCVLQQDHATNHYESPAGGISGETRMRSGGIILDSYSTSFNSTTTTAPRGLSHDHPNSLLPSTTSTTTSFLSPTTIVAPRAAGNAWEDKDGNQGVTPPNSVTTFLDDQSEDRSFLDDRRSTTSIGGMQPSDKNKLEERTAGGRGPDEVEQEDDTREEGEPIVVHSTNDLVYNDHDDHGRLPTISGSKLCLADLVLMTQDATRLTRNPISIVSQDEKTVTFTISNPFATTREPPLWERPTMFYQYAAAKTGATNCGAIKTSDQQPVEIMAHCMTSPSRQSSLTILDVWFVDPRATRKTTSVFDALDVDQDYDALPDQCFKDIAEMKEQQPDGSILSNGELFLYSYKIYCKSQCTPPDTVKSESVEAEHDDHERDTSPSSFKALSNNNDLLNKNNDEGHQVHCKASDYPCGTDNGSMVTVCHYSTKDGYRTHCIPQSDSSSLIGYFWRDYCGPCVVEGDGK